MRQESEGKLTNWLKRTGLAFSVNEGGGTHYAPKVGLNFRDTMDRSWTLGTMQLDYVMPARFQLAYMASDGHPTGPVMIHRAILGSLERFVGVYVEHTGGKFPLWLAPDRKSTRLNSSH